MPKTILSHCVLSKITVSNNFMEIQMGVGVFELGNPEGKGAEAFLKIQVDGGVKQTVPSVVGVWIFSGITQLMQEVLEFFPSVLDTSNCL